MEGGTGPEAGCPAVDTASAFAVAADGRVTCSGASGPLTEASAAAEARAIAGTWVEAVWASVNVGSAAANRTAPTACLPIVRLIDILPAFIAAATS
jgi:hypothetical protein